MDHIFVIQRKIGPHGANLLKSTDMKVYERNSRSNKVFFSRKN